MPDSIETKIRPKPLPSRRNLGAFLKEARVKRGLSLEELAFATRISIENLGHIESSRWESLPHEVFVRGFLASYAKEVGLDSEKILRIYGNMTSENPSQAPLTSLMATEKGQRFGLALAVVVLLILFTLTLSIVLQPRRRNVPLELSKVELLSAPSERYLWLQMFI